MNRKVLIVLVGLGIALSAVTVTAPEVSAQETYTPLVTLPGVTTAGKPTNPVEMIKGFYGLAIGIGSVIAVAMIIIAGFKYMYQESISGKSGAKEQITNAFIGLLVILASYIILRTINADLVNFNLNLPGSTGRLTGLVAEQKRQEDIVSAIARANKKYFAEQDSLAKSKADLAGLDSQINAARAEIDAINKDTKLSKEEKEAKIKEMQDKIDGIGAQKQTLATQITEKSISSASDILETLLSDGQNNTALTQLLAAKKFKEGDYEAGKSSDEVFNSILASKDSLMKRLDNELAKVKELPESPEKQRLVDDFTKQITAYKDYASVSRQAVAGYHQILKTATPGKRMEERMSIIDAKVVAFTASVEEHAVRYESIGQPKLAAQLREDIKNSNTIVKVIFSSSCNDKTSNLSMCSN